MTMRARKALDEHEDSIESFHKIQDEGEPQELLDKHPGLVMSHPSQHQLIGKCAYTMQSTGIEQDSKGLAAAHRPTPFPPSFCMPFHSQCYNTVRTPTLCKPDTSDRPYLFSLSTYLI
jgi:hypothetical protein